jgi:NAD+ synthetase
VASLQAALVLGLRDYFRKCGFADAVLGLSGGIDSALVACLAAEALGPDHVLAVAMPSRYSAEQSESDARRLAANLGIQYRVIPIGEVHAAFERTLAEVFAGLAADITEENIQARIRGVILMALSNKFRRLLLATGNKSELAAGYCTLYGDMCGGLAPIGDVPKTLVYQLARHVNRRGEVIPESILRRPPTAELKPNQTDQDTLPPYDVVDRIIEHYVENLETAEKLVASGIDPAAVEKMVRLIDGSEYKRRQAAPVLKVTGRAFGMGRRMPIAQRWRNGIS